MPKKPEDLTGQRFGKLVALRYVKCSTRSKWLCRCDCNNYHHAEVADLKRGSVKSCGCLRQKTKNQDDIKETIFNYVAASEGVPVSEIASCIEASCSAIHSALKALEDKDLVRREKKNGIWRWFKKTKELSIVDNALKSFCF